MKTLKGAETKLERATQRICNYYIKNGGYDTAESWLNDLLQHGCVSGMVGELVSYHDTLKFYKAHKEEIKNMLKELCNDCGCTPSGLLGDKWDNDDFFAKDTNNQNLLAWFGFEETARQLAYKNGIEV